MILGIERIEMASLSYLQTYVNTSLRAGGEILAPTRSFMPLEVFGP